MPGPANYLAEGLWHHNSGKNASCSNAMAEWVLSDTDGEGEYGIVGPTYADAWTKCVEGKTGILRALGTSMGEIKDHRSRTVRGAWRTYGQVLLHNGITIYVDSAAEGGLRVQGRNLKGAWCSEIGLWDKWETAWKESVVYAVRDGKSQIIVDGTPKASRKARKLIRSFIRNDPEHGGVIIRKLRTRDNIKNLSEAFVRAVIGGFKGTRLELQELEGELLDDVANALWTRDLLDSIKCPGFGEPGGPQTLLKTYIGVDPSDGDTDSDEQAYTVIGKGMPEDKHLYVTENWGGQESPPLFAKRVIRKAVEWNATIVVEKNHGGKWLTSVFQQAQKDMGTHVRVEVVHASDAKRARAEPVAVMYDRISEDGLPLVLHCHRTWTIPCDCGDRAHPDGHLRTDEHMPELEDSMATFTGAAGEKSPDRLDSLCLAGGTPVLTARGEVPIEDVIPGELVWTRQGWKPVEAAVCTRRDAEVMTVELSDGRTLTGTPDHRVWVETRGWTEMRSLVWGDTLSGWGNRRQNRQSRSRTGVSRTNATPTRNNARTVSTTALRAAADETVSTVTSGGTTTPARRFPRAGTSTTTTTTRSTTSPATWFSALPGSTPPSTPRSSACHPSTLRRYALSPLNGTAARKAVPGMLRTAGRSGSAANLSIRRSAPDAVAVSSPTSRSAETSATAPGGASTGPASGSTLKRSPARSAAARSSATSTGSAPKPAPVSVVRSCASSERQPVYDLTVADAHEFTAAGVIVHNCWAASKFLRETFGPPGPSGKRDWAAAQGLAAAAVTEEGRAMRRMREVRERAAPGLEDAPWDLDGFAPDDDDEGRGPGRNARQWGGGQSLPYTCVW